MRQSRWIPVLMALMATYICAQQPLPPAQDQTKDLPVKQGETPQPSGKDKSLACPWRTESRPGTEKIYKVGKGVTPPRATNTVYASFSEEAQSFAKKKHLKNFEAASIVSVVIDAQGNPQSICVIRPAGLGLDRKAIEAVEQYRFEPATKDGLPVAVSIAVEVKFRLY